MDRRSAVKNLMVASGGLITLPYWMEACGISDRNEHQTSFSPTEQKILARITDTIIPAGNVVGALSVGVDKFLQKLIDDCYEKPIQENVKKQLRILDDKTRAIHGKSFEDCSPQQREEMLLKWQGSQVKEEKDFFELMKSQTIFGFNTSQKVMQDYLHYEVAPGHYYGCINVKA
jgi:acyl CoA:acetate/3-ketoacid CoA transferase